MCREEQVCGLLLAEPPAPGAAPCLLASSKTVLLTRHCSVSRSGPAVPPGRPLHTSWMYGRVSCRWKSSSSLKTSGVPAVLFPFLWPFFQEQLSCHWGEAACWSPAQPRSRTWLQSAAHLQPGGERAARQPLTRPALGTHSPASGGKVRPWRCVLGSALPTGALGTFPQLRLCAPLAPHPLSRPTVLPDPACPCPRGRV